jgi:hypothetical protein
MPTDSAFGKIILWSLTSGAVVFAAIYFVFGDGWLMGLFLAVEGSFIGAIIGTSVGLVIILLKRLTSRGRS